MREGLSLPKYAYGQDGFSKKRMVPRLLNNKQMRGFSTFQAITVKATGIYSFFILFLRSSRSVGMSLWAGAGLAQNDQGFPQRNLSRRGAVRS